MKQPNPSRSTVPHEYILIAMVLVLSAATGFLIRLPIVDDAYITFRYALNIARGLGCLYNPAELTLGLTTPLWALILAALAPAVPSFEFGAIAVTMVSMSCIGLLIYFRYLRAMLDPLEALLIFPLLFLFLHTHAATFSAMEATPFTLCVMVALALPASRYSVVVATSAALSLLFRPDGIIVVFLVLLSLARSPRACLKALVVIALIIAPWIIYALTTYGSITPLSIAAKRIVHPSTVAQNIYFLAQGLFSQRLGDLFGAVLGVVGLVRLSRDAETRSVALFPLLYLCGLIVSGIQPIFYWYYSPLWFFFITFGLYGVLLLINEAQGPRIKVLRRPFALCALTLISLSLPSLLSRDPGMERDEVYHQIVSDFAERIPPSNSLYLCETGILGFGFQNNFVYDAAGINSRPVFEHRKRLSEDLRPEARRLENQDRSTQWSISFVHEHLPDWIISPRHYCQLALMEDEGWFRENYTRKALYTPNLLGGIAVYERVPVSH